MNYLFSTVFLFLGSVLFSQMPQLSSETFWAIEADTAISVYSNGPSATLFTGSSINAVNWNDSLHLTVDQPVSFSVSSPHRTVIMAVRLNGDTTLLASRRLHFEGAANLRDIGGIPAHNGKSVVWNRVFRCGDMGKLTDNDLAIIEHLNIGAVIDFRNEREIKESKDRYPEGMDIKRIHANIGASGSDANIESFFKVILDPNADAKTAHYLMRNLYVGFAKSLIDFKPLFEALLTVEKPLLFHCTAGKDRTGIASALLLYALGVDEDIIIEEFYLSNKYTRSLDNKLTHPMMKDVNKDVLNVVMGVHPEYIEAYFLALRNEFGSIEVAMETQLGVGKNEVEKLRFLYLR